MPKKYGVKEKDLVVSHVVNLILTGKLRSGDRIDRNEIAHELGLSRVPIQEAVVQLEHDGILSTQYHRGAYVERFDESVVREHHELYGLLNGVASARAAADANPQFVEQFGPLLDIMRSSKESRAFQEAAWRFRLAGGDPRVADSHSTDILVGLPQQPRRDTAVLRGGGRSARPPRSRHCARGLRPTRGGDEPDHADRAGPARST